MRTPYRIAAVSAFSQALEEFFHKLGLPYFLGGSRRFGYQRPESDTDLFILVRDEQTEKDLADCLVSMGFREQRNDHAYPLKQCDRLFALPEVFHVVIIRDEDNYSNLEKEHETVARMVSDSPDLRKLAMLLRYQNVKGAHIFRALLTLANLTQAG